METTVGSKVDVTGLESFQNSNKLENLVLRIVETQLIGRRGLGGGGMALLGGGGGGFVAKRGDKRVFLSIN